MPIILPSFLFVCTGNICRSPLAEAAMRAEADRRGLTLDIDSAGTGSWHLGDPPDPRARATARRHGLDIDRYIARQVGPADFERFTHILALDLGHHAALLSLAPKPARGRISLLLDHLPGQAGQEVADPYFGPDAGFEATWREVSEACRHLAAATLDRTP